MAGSRSEEVKTPLARAAYADNLFKPRASEEGGKPKLGLTLLFPKSTDISALKKLAADTAVAEWGDKAVDWVKSGVIKTPFLDGDGPQAVSKKTGERHKGFEGCTFIRCTATVEYPPKVYDQRVLPAGPDVVYSGCYGYAVVNAFTWEGKSGKGISFGISMFQKAKDGDKIGNGGGPANPDAFFDKIADEGAAPDMEGKGAGGMFD